MGNLQVHFCRAPVKESHYAKSMGDFGFSKTRYSEVNYNSVMPFPVIHGHRHGLCFQSKTSKSWDQCLFSRKGKLNGYWKQVLSLRRERRAEDQSWETALCPGLRWWNVGQERQPGAPKSSAGCLHLCPVKQPSPGPPDPEAAVTTGHCCMGDSVLHTVELWTVASTCPGSHTGGDVHTTERSLIVASKSWWGFPKYVYDFTTYPRCQAWCWAHNSISINIHGIKPKTWLYHEDSNFCWVCSRM